MAGLLGEKLPQCYKPYNINTTPGKPVFAWKTAKIFAAFQWSLDIPQNLTLCSYDDNGVAADKMFEDKLFKTGDYKLTAKFESSRIASGNYYIRLLSGSTLLKETKVTVE